MQLEPGPAFTSGITGCGRHFRRWCADVAADQHLINMTGYAGIAAAHGCDITPVKG